MMRDAPLPYSRSARAWFSLVAATMKSKWIYRLAIASSLVTTVAGCIVMFLIWNSVYEGQTHVAGLGRQALLAYLVMAFSVDFVVQTQVEARVGHRITLGLVTVDLLRPMRFLPLHLGQASGDAAVSLLIVVPAFALAVLLLGADVGSVTAATAVAGTASTLLAFLVNFGICFTTAQAYFVLNSHYGVMFSRSALHTAFSGLFAPLSFFPEPLAAVAKVLPFRHVIETPALIWLGHTKGAEALMALLQQAAWAVVGLALSTCLFGVALRRHQFQGG